VRHADTQVLTIPQRFQSADAAFLKAIPSMWGEAARGAGYTLWSPTALTTVGRTCLLSARLSANQPVFPRRGSALRRKQSSARKRDSRCDSNAVTSVGVQGAPSAPWRAAQRPPRVLRWLLLISGRALSHFGEIGMNERLGDDSRRIRDLSSPRPLACGRDRPAASQVTGRTSRRDG
jgi:hypothetical protein